MFVFDALCLKCVRHNLCVNYVCMYTYFEFSTFLAIESNDECAEEGEIFEYQEEEDQGKATQGRPSTCCIPES
jgi:hypothetical protein